MVDTFLPLNIQTILSPFPFFCTFPIHSLRMKTIHTFLLLIICLSNDVRKMTKYHKLYNLQINFPTSFLRSSKKKKHQSLLYFNFFQSHYTWLFPESFLIISDDTWKLSTIIIISSLHAKRDNQNSYFSSEIFKTQKKKKANH